MGPTSEPASLPLPGSAFHPSGESRIRSEPHAVGACASCWSIGPGANAAPRKCYGYLFTYTIKNIGRLASGNFSYKVETAGQSGAYGVWSLGGPVSLKPGESLTYSPSPVDNQYWCLDDTWKSKVKVTADIDNKVHETNKTNNVLEKVFALPHFTPGTVQK